VPDGEVASLKDVWKAYRDEEYVLRGVNLSLRAGEFIAIHGRSGSGKSTLLRLLGLMDRPTKGEVTLLGRATSAVSDSEAAGLRLQNVGFVFQSLSLIPNITVLENIELPMWMKKVQPQERKRRAMELLTHFGLEGLAARWPTEISMGEQQRVAAMRAVANGPSILLADEPTAHLDDASAGTLLDLFRRLNGEIHVTVAMTTTSEEEAGSAGRELALLNGKLS
jgi:ABC-type lipoprotein export system ATPase subunit